MFRATLSTRPFPLCSCTWGSLSPGSCPCCEDGTSRTRPRQAPAIPATQQAESFTGVLLKAEVSVRAARQHPTPPSKTKGFLSDKTLPNPRHNEMKHKGRGKARAGAPLCPQPASPRCLLPHFLAFKGRSQFTSIPGLNSLSAQITHSRLQRGFSTDEPKVQLSRSTRGCCTISGARGARALLQQPAHVGAGLLAATPGLHPGTRLRARQGGSWAVQGPRPALLAVAG